MDMFWWQIWPALLFSHEKATEGSSFHGDIAIGESTQFVESSISILHRLKIDLGIHESLNWINWIKYLIHKSEIFFQQSLYCRYDKEEMTREEAFKIKSYKLGGSGAIIRHHNPAFDGIINSAFIDEPDHNK